MSCWCHIGVYAFIAWERRGRKTAVLNKTGRMVIIQDWDGQGLANKRWVFMTVLHISFRCI